MSGCCSGSRRVIIEATVPLADGEPCDRRGITLEAVRTAALELEAELAAVNVSVVLVEHSATSERLQDSNAVLVNGRPHEATTVEQVRDAVFTALGTDDAWGCA